MPSLSEINQAIVAAFPSEDALHRAVLFAIDKNLYEVAGQKALPYMVFELVAWSEARGETDRLLRGLLKQNPGNLKLQKVCGQSPSPATITPTIQQEPAMDNNTQKIASPHLNGLFEHIETALKCGEVESLRFVQELIESDTTYAKLAELDRDTIADAARATIPGVKAVRINDVVRLLKLFRSDLRVSEKEGLLDIKYNTLTDQWERVAGDTCVRDGSLFSSVAFPKPIVGWNDGKLYPAGSEFDDEGNPLTVDGVRAYLLQVRQGHLHPWIVSSMEKSSFSLMDLLRYLRKSSCKDAIQIYNFLTSPQTTLAPSQVAVEKIFRDCERSLQGAPPNLIENIPDYVGAISLATLRRAFAETYPSAADARRVAQDAGLRVIRLNFGGSAEDIWSEIVEEARKQQRLGLLVQIAAEAYPSNPIFRNYQ